MKLKVNLLDSGQNELAYASSQDKWLRTLGDRLGQQGYEVDGEMQVKLDVTKLEPDYVFRGNLHFSVGRTCDRCAEQFVLPIAHGFELAFARAAEPGASKEVDEQAAQLDMDWFQGDEIDLDAVLEEQMLLSIPYKNLCRDDCKGMCQQCGQNLNQGPCQCKSSEEDNPFAVLKKLKG